MATLEEDLQIELARWSWDKGGEAAFVAGVRWADAAPQGDHFAEAERRYSGEDRAKLFIAGASWLRMRVRDTKKADARDLQSPDTLYIGAIFPGADERGIDFEAVVSDDLESLKVTLESLVRQSNSDDGRAEDLDYEWTPLDFYPVNDPEYGFFAWARIKEITAGSPVRISEYNF